MQIKALTIIVSILAIIAGCGAAGGKEPISDYDAKNKLQFETLSFIFFRGNPMPPPPSAEERQAATQMALRHTRDSAKLREIFHSDLDLWVYATRDTDGDGTLDYRIDDEHGRFMEGDMDIDGDGTPNTLDVKPYRPNTDTPDSNNNDIPDHIDWALQGKSRKMAGIQQKLYQDHGIILVERSANFTEPLARSVEDVITRVFKPLFVEKKRLPTLKTVATVRWPALDKATDDGTRAQVVGQNGTLSVFQYGINLNRFLQLGLLSHELTHSFQFSLDYSESDRKELDQNIYYARNFYAVVKQFGWSFTKQPVDSAEIYKRISLQYQEINPYQIKYEGVTYNEWMEAIDDKALDDPLLRAARIVGTYSLLSPWEWHADYMNAYVFIGMENHAKRFCSRDELKQLKKLAKADNIKAWDFYHGNARRNQAAMKYFAEAFPITEEDWSYLTREYLLGSYPDVCTKAGT